MRLKTIEGLVLAALVPCLAPGALGCQSEVKVAAATPPPPPPAPPPPAPAPPPPPMKGAQLDITGEIEFDVGQGTIKDSSASQSVLNAALTALQGSPSITKLRVEGHTDSDGSAATNIALGEKRANAVAAWLTAKGIDGKRLRAVGCGSKDPIAPNTTAEGKARNRRTEFDVEEIDGKKPNGYTEPCAPNPSRGK